MMFMENYFSSKDNSTKISWSKNGFIAYSLPHKEHNLYITQLECIDSKNWQLVKPHALRVQPDNAHHSQFPVPEISTLCWSNTGSDLAVTDLMGNMTILLSGITENHKAKNSTTNNGPHLQMTSFNEIYTIYRDTVPRNINNIDDSPFKIVGFKWLNVEKQIIINKPAVKIDNEGDKGLDFYYNYGVSQYTPFGAMHPISSKQASIGVRRNGEICLWYQAEHGIEYGKVSNFLESEFEQDWISYASIGFQKNNVIMIAVYNTLSRYLKVYSVNIEWNHLLTAAQLQKENPNYQTPNASQIPPKLNIKRTLRKKITDLSKDGGLNILNGIEIISPNFNSDSELDILLLFQNANGTSSSIRRFQLNDRIMPLHESFSSLGFRQSESNDALKNELKTEIPSSKQLFLILKDTFRFDKSILSIGSINCDLFIYLTFKDGSIDFISRKTMRSECRQTNTETAPTVISSLFDAGFTLPPPKSPPYFISVSPNFCSYVTIPVDFMNKKLNQLYLQTAERDISQTLKNDNSGQISAKDLLVTSAGFAFRHSYSCYTNTSGEDLIATIQVEVNRIRKLTSEDTSKKLMMLILHESHKAINFSLDVYTREQVDRLLSNPPLQRLLSLQMSLGYTDDGNKTTSGRIAWALLNLRCVSFSMMFTLSTLLRHLNKRTVPNQETLQDSQWKSETLFAILGSTRWHLDFMIFLNQELLELCGINSSSTGYAARLNRSVALPMILAKVPRSLLIYSINTLKKTCDILKKLILELTECNKLYPPMKESYNRFMQIFANSPINLEGFEKYLLDVDNALRSMRFDKSLSLSIEQELVCKGTIPTALIDPSNKIIELYGSSVRKDVKTSELYFYDVDWISLHDNVPMVEVKKEFETLPVINYPAVSLDNHIRNVSGLPNGAIVDSLRKVVLPHSILKRKCVRCRSVSGTYDSDVYDVMIQATGFWSMAFQRNCICGSSWVNID